MAGNHVNVLCTVRLATSIGLNTGLPSLAKEFLQSKIIIPFLFSGSTTCYNAFQRAVVLPLAKIIIPCSLLAAGKDIKR